MKIYIGGPISGIKNYRNNFKVVEEKLLSDGHQVMNPAVISEGFPYTAYMPVCLPMLECCDAIYLLEGWTNSTGAKLECHYAKVQGKKIFLQSLDQYMIEDGDRLEFSQAPYEQIVKVESDGLISGIFTSIDSYTTTKLVRDDVKPSEESDYAYFMRKMLEDIAYTNTTPAEYIQGLRNAQLRAKRDGLNIDNSLSGSDRSVLTIKPIDDNSDACSHVTTSINLMNNPVESMHDEINCLLDGFTDFVQDNMKK